MENKIIVNKAFISQSSCFKVQLIQRVIEKDGRKKTTKECYMHTGKRDGSKWAWKKAKFSDIELGDMVVFLSGSEKTVSFFHNYDGKQVQIYFNRSEYRGKMVVSPIIGKLPGKSLAKGEQKVLEILLHQIIARMNL